MITDREFWESRYRSRDYIYGRIANEFFKEMIKKNRLGKILCIGEGEGRNACYAANKGWQVTATDFIPNAKIKAMCLAEEKKVNFDYIVCDIRDFPFVPESFDYVSLIHCHFPSELREFLFEKVMEIVKPGGGIIFEGMSTLQYMRESGGPEDMDRLYTGEWIRNHLPDFYYTIFRQEEVPMNEGVYYVGMCNMIQFMAYKPEY